MQQRLLSPLGVDGLPVPVMLQVLCGTGPVRLQLQRGLVLPVALPGILEYNAEGNVCEKMCSMKQQLIR